MQTSITQTPLAGDDKIPKEYLRVPDHQLLPPRVGHNWNDQAFRKVQGKPQQLEAEWRAKRAFISEGNHYVHPPEHLGFSAQQLILALSSKRSKGRGTTEDPKYVTLDDKVLRFYAFFSERAPEGGANDYWHRRVTIFFYPDDDTVMIQEPRISNSGLDGGTYLKRQKVKADARQRELFPNDEYLTLNYFNVGHSVRINSVEFFLYDCDSFTRDLLTTLGVEVGPAIPAPDDKYMAANALHQHKVENGKFGILSQNFEAGASERAARFVRDGGKMLRFYAVLDERETVPSGIVRQLEVLMFVEDNTIAVVERQCGREATPGLFLSRGWLPKDGSVAKANELTFSHRVNGQREPYMGPDTYYKETDLNVGTTINLLGRRVLLYDCDDFTRSFYKSRYGIVLNPPLEVEHLLACQRQSKMSGRRLIPVNEDREQKRPVAQSTGRPTDILRFLMLLAKPCSHTERHRRFTLTYYTDTDEVMVHETPTPNSGIPGGCFFKRQRLFKPQVPNGLRNAPGQPQRGKNDVYTLDDIAVGKEIVVGGFLFTITNMDAHTAAYFSGKPAQPPSSELVQHLLSELQEHMGSRYRSVAEAFLAFDLDKDGVISFNEFVSSLRLFQITAVPAEAQALFRIIACTDDTAYLTTEDLMKWMSGEKNEGCLRHGAGTTGMKEQQWEIERRALQKRVLHEIRERLDAKCMNSTEMFRLASVMPRAYRGQRSDIHCLTNPDRDAIVTPVQLRRCIHEVLCASFTPDEMGCVLEFFFPQMPLSERFRERDDVLDYYMDLKAFQMKYNEMCQLEMLVDSTKGFPSSKSNEL